MRLLLTGGGTGGHVYPAIALAEAFALEPAFAPLEVLFVGTRDRLEAQIVPKAGYALAFIHAAPLERGFSLSIVTTVVANAAGFVEALGVLHRARPDVLVATGGYVAFPIVAALRAIRALRRSNARIAVLETNASPGLANRLLGPMVDEIWYAVAPPQLGPKEFVVGMPVRSSMRRPMDPLEARVALGLEPEKTTIVVMGGSQGARAINDAVAALVEGDFPEAWQVLLVAGAREGDRLRMRLARRARVRVVGYLDDPRAAYAAADLVVARSGASTLGELAATATPALLVPYPYATGDHQTHNARTYAASGAARILTDAALQSGALPAELASALVPDALTSLRAGAQMLAKSDPRATIVARVKNWLAAKRDVP